MAVSPGRELLVARRSIRATVSKLTRTARVVSVFLVGGGIGSTGTGGGWGVGVEAVCCCFGLFSVILRTVDFDMFVSSCFMDTDKDGVCQCIRLLRLARGVLLSRV